ncbi:ImmA/IrrE family metallo-endopeptidase [Streptomyces akebiae]|uniref:ImmA/IrrE family metallo-endopeptidase n=1 Tax=Streptomyces akebiae TaxID=2865673 RepID=A0ABX8XVK2_9ACTN|nr:ImmA/IrrE family metallo-endopeptidase [Streptomyces akebiae]QYX79975.1 ImmA/IrrE family metallo-endopeptidase [Streptomyces akebiae]
MWAAAAEGTAEGVMMAGTSTREERFKHTLNTLVERECVTRETLLDLLGSKESYAALTSGSRLPSAYEATLLSAFFRVAPGLLLQGDEPSMGVSLRLGTIDGIHDVSDAVSHATKLLATDRLTREWGCIQPIIDVASFAPSKVWHDRNAGERTAARLRAYLDFSETEPIEDLTGLVESLGVPVEYRQLPDKVHGISIPEKWGDCVSWVVVINSNDVWSRQRFTLAHELCHVLQNDPGQVIVDRAQMQDLRPERIANSFARHFLLPEEALLDKLEKHGSISTKTQAAALVADIILNYGVSRDATMIALGEVAEDDIERSLVEFCQTAQVSELMRISGYSATWDELNSTRGESFPSERLSQQVLDAYAEQLVSLQAVADVIANGSVENARLQLSDAGWDMDQR